MLTENGSKIMVATLDCFFMPFSQVLKGDIKEAICTHALYYAIWKKYEAMPERFNWRTKQSDVHFSPLRPELVESTYLLHQVRLVGQYFVDYQL